MSIESRLNFSSNQHHEKAIELKDGCSESYYQDAFSSYCNENKIDNSDDNCSAMIMSDYTSEKDTFWFWIDEALDE